MCIRDSATEGGFAVFDEINMAKNDSLAVIYSALDYRRTIDLPGYDKIVLAGGVSNNKALREALAKEERAHGFKLYYPKAVYTTDNAAMIAAQGYLEYVNGGEFRDLGFEVDPNLGL